MKNIVFFDIDGTLWDDRMQIPKSTAEAVRLLRENGDYAFICSGRSRANIRSKNLLDLGFDGIVCACGGYVEYRGEHVFENLMTADQIRTVLAVLKKHNVPAVLEGPEYVYVSPDDFLDDPYVIHLREELKGYVADIGMDAEKMVINKLSAALYGADLTALKKDLGEEFDVVDHGGGLVEINPQGYSKATGIEKICEKLHISHENTYAFGDSANDIEMLLFVAHGIAMGNGSKAAKEAAEYITSDIHEDGIYLGLKHYGLI